jgi:hypothetical protein
MRQIRDEVSLEIIDMNFEEERDCLNNLFTGDKTGTGVD